MITKKERKTLKKILGFDYTTAVQKLLAERKVLSRLGIPHKKSYITSIFNGQRANNDIEKAIYDVYLQRKEAAATEAKQREEILNS